MYPATWPGYPLSADRPSPQDLQTLLAQARALQRGTLPRQPLQGKRLGLICRAGGGEDAELFRLAAQELGAHVAVIPAPPEPSEEDRQQLADIGRLLGRLYDALECQGLSPELVRQLAAASSIPVFDGLASRGHPILGLSKELAASAPPDDRRRWLVQAALMASLA